MEYATLNNGIKMPMAGIGTFLLTPDEAETSVLSALQCGYRLIDTANAYVNEKAVGRAMRKSGIPRDEIFLETKLWPSFYEQEDAVEKTLQRLGTDYIDLLLIHQPAGNYVAGYRLLDQRLVSMTQRIPCLDDDAFFIKKCLQFFLLRVGVHLCLEHGRLYLTDVQNLLHLLRGKVGKANGAHLALFVGFLHKPVTCRAPNRGAPLLAGERTEGISG